MAQDQDHEKGGKHLTEPRDDSAFAPRAFKTNSDGNQGGDGSWKKLCSSDKTLEIFLTDGFFPMNKMLFHHPDHGDRTAETGGAQLQEVSEDVFHSFSVRFLPHFLNENN